MYAIRSYYDFSSLTRWISERHGWNVKREWIEFSPGVVPALNICTLAYTGPGDEIIIQPPVYTPFHSAVKDHGRKLLFNNLLETERGWTIRITSYNVCYTKL